MVSQTIEMIFADLCVKHDLIVISVSYNAKCSEGNEWYAYTHWENNKGRCGSGGGENATKAIEAAIKDAIGIRSTTVDVPADLEMTA